MRTPLYPVHKALKARIVDFHGWDMPIQYKGLVDEHNTVRNAAGLFDVSHMGRIRIAGADRVAYLNNLVTVNVEKIKPGRIKYSFFLTESGGVIDDLLIYQDGETLLLVVNAGNRDTDWDWMQKHTDGFDVTLTNESDSTALVAVQGPKALDIVNDVLDIDASSVPYYGLDHFTFRDKDLLVSRTGYTGEDGFELMVQTEDCVELAKRLLKGGKSHGLRPAGLGARDTLRFEAGMPLHGNELDTDHTPLQAQLKFAVSFKKGDYIGKAALEAEKEKGPERLLVGLIPVDADNKRAPRSHYALLSGGETVGEVTSGSFSPTMDKALAMGYVRSDMAEIGTELQVDIRGTHTPYTVTALPFYKREK